MKKIRDTLPFQGTDPAGKDFQYLEDLATAYWHSEVLFAALDLDLFGWIERGCDRRDALADAARCRPAELGRLLRVLLRMELVLEDGGRWFNTPRARRFLVPEHDDYMGDFLLYRRYMQPRWAGLADRVARPDGSRLEPPAREPAREDDYRTRNMRYVRSTDRLARRKSREILPLLARVPWRGPLLDAGGGAGSLGRSILGACPSETGVLFDLPEVIEAARQFYPDAGHWRGLSPVAGDFRHPPFAAGSFGLVVLSNFLHAYDPVTARKLLAAAVSLVRPDGMILIHDYFPDRWGARPHKGPLYDLNMMLNTYNGVCHDSRSVMQWLKEDGIDRSAVMDLGTDTSVVLAGFPPHLAALLEDPEGWAAAAREAGFRHAVPIAPADIVVAGWPGWKCRFGCGRYGRGLQCPPHAMTPEDLRALLAEYSRAVLVQGSPPGKTFHRNLLALERSAFLKGFHKALAFGAGPCTVCDACPEDGVCRHPETARPAMEACGIDVYATARRAGRPLAPVQERGDWVTYTGLLLLE